MFLGQDLGGVSHLENDPGNSVSVMENDPEYGIHIYPNPFTVNIQVIKTGALISEMICIKKSNEKIIKKTIKNVLTD